MPPSLCGKATESRIADRPVAPNRVRLHQDVLRVDRIKLRRWYFAPEDYAEMSRCFDFMITPILADRH